MTGAPVERLAWDSEFFGLEIARLTLPRLDAAGWARTRASLEAEPVDCLYFLASANDAQSVRVAEDGGFRLVDVRVTLGRDLDGMSGSVPPPVVTHASGDLDALAAIARVSHRDSRFYSDPGFSTEQCEALYEAWIRNSCAGYADTVLVSRDGGSATGYVTCHLGEDFGQIGLIAVAESAQGRGIGGNLVNSSVAWFVEHGRKRVIVATQARNTRAIRMYERLGFVTESVELWFHYWPAAGKSP